MTEDRNAIIATVLPDYRRWLHATAYDLLPADSPDHDDLTQEGYIAMWRAFETFDPAQGTLAPWLTTAARQRMRDVAHGHGQWTGHEAMRGRREVATTSLDEILDTDPDTALGAADLLDGIESAYHDGEIAAAMSALNPQQRAYVYARFYLGIDPTSREPVVRALVAEFPVLRKRWLWTGSSKYVGARDRLAERLAHLAPA